MRPRGHNQVLNGAALLLAAALIVESGWLIAAWRGARQAEAGLARRDGERRALAAQDPAPTAERAAAIEADRFRAATALRTLESRLWRPGAAAVPPASPTDAYFALTAFARTIADQATRAGVGLKDGERFGFSDYTHHGPTAALVPPVDRQRRIATTLLQLLIAARPHRIDGVQRENPGIGAAKVAGAAGGEAGSGDYFALDPRLSLRQPGAVDTAAFRLSFTGDSRTLRNLLNRLAAFDCPVVLRSLAVEPAGDLPPLRPAPPGRRQPLALVVRGGRSRFSVAVEFCDLLGPASGVPRLAPAEGAVWPEPTAQPRGRDWVYDLFTPPAVYHDSRGPALHAAATAGAATTEPADRLSDLDLVEVRRGPFRVQLIGYAGRPDELRGIFAAAGSGETVVGRSGDRLPGAGITIRHLGFEQPDATAAGDTTAREPAAIALVADDATGREVELTTRTPCLDGAPVGLFASRRAAALRREAEAGESFVLDGNAYCVEQIDLEPPQALVACASGDGAGAPIRRVIHRSAPPEAPAAAENSAVEPDDATIGNTP